MTKNNRQATPSDHQHEETDETRAHASTYPPLLLKRVRDHHHRIARMIAEGKRTTEIAAATGLSIQRVSLLKADPDFGTLIAIYRERLNSGGRSPKNKLQDDWDDDLDRLMVQMAESQRAAERERTTAAAPLAPPSEEPKRTLRRWSAKYEWDAIYGEIARRCIDPKTRRVKVPKNESKLADDVLQWCEDTDKDQPGLTDMRDAVHALCEALRKI